MLALYEAETGEPWPEDPADQLEAAARAMARAWNAPSARILRQAKGAPEHAGLGLVVQRMALGARPRRLRLRATCSWSSSRTGAPDCVGDYLPQAQGTGTRLGPHEARPLTLSARLAAGTDPASLERSARGAGRAPRRRRGDRPRPRRRLPD